MRPVSVSQVNEYIAKKLRDDYNLKGLAVEGEISGLSRSGQHYYLTLKDAESQIRCAIWGSNAAKINMELVENGKKIVAVCDISPYAKGGTYSLSIRHVEAAGEGDLMNLIRHLDAKHGGMVQATLCRPGIFNQALVYLIDAARNRIAAAASSDNRINSIQVNMILLQELMNHFHAVIQLVIDRRKVQQHGGIMKDIRGKDVFPVFK